MNKHLSRYQDMSLKEKFKSINSCVLRIFITPFMFGGLYWLGREFGFGLKSELAMWGFILLCFSTLGYECFQKVKILKEQLLENKGKEL